MEGQGLSPLARGNPHPAPPCPIPKGSIPACAGEPQQSALSQRVERVYPRLRGGTRFQAVFEQQVRGLSPLARGNRVCCGDGAAAQGSIPACAGEPAPRSAVISCVRVYPRLRGGTKQPDGSPWRHWGLSPLARGNPGAHQPQAGASRSIPACAGEPRSWRRDWPSLRVYPRLRGGTPQVDGFLMVLRGLSPLARGNRHALFGDSAQAGSIPACAGEPRQSVINAWFHGVYPRLRGGTIAWLWLTPTQQGLSPLARGNRRARLNRAAPAVSSC